MNKTRLKPGLRKKKSKAPVFIADVEKKYLEWKKNLDFFSKNLAEIRKRRKITQYKLGKISGIDQSDVSKIERGAVSNLTFHKLFKYVHALGVKMEFNVYE